MQGRNSDRRGGVASLRLEDDVGLGPYLGYLLGYDEASVGAGDDARPCEQDIISQPR